MRNTGIDIAIYILLGCSIALSVTAIVLTLKESLNFLGGSIMEAKKDYSAQQKHLRSHYVRFGMDFRPEVLEQFKAVCAKNGTTPTTEIKKFVAAYLEENSNS